MSSEPTQSFANHTRWVPGYHFATTLFALIFLLWSIWHAISTRLVDAHFEMVGAFALFGTTWYTRVFPIKAQDRVIRLEEQLRMERLLPTDLRARAGELSARQLIALRFASDAELPELVGWVLTENVTDIKLIKQRIRTWRPDTHRV